MNIFIYSSSYTVLTLLYNLEYCIQKHIDNIFVLSENHSNYEYEYSFPFSIKCLPSVWDCVKNSDLSLVFKQSNSPKHWIDKVEQLCKDLSKEIIIINDPWSCVYECFKHDVLYTKPNKPSIDIVHSGIHSQPFIVELMLNKIFMLDNVNFFQFFTESTHDLLCQFKASGILNDRIAQMLDDDISEPDIIIYAFDVGDNLQYLEDYIEYRKHEKPDFIFFQTTLDHVDYVEEHINNKFYYTLERQLDCVNTSLYHSILLNYNDYVYCKKGTLSSENMYSTFDSLTECTIKKMIFKKTALPSGIIPM